MAQALSLIPLDNPYFNGIVSDSDRSILEKGMTLIDQSNPDIRGWITKRKGDFNKIQEVAQEALLVKTELNSTFKTLKKATNQVEQSEQNRKNIEEIEKRANEAYQKQHTELQSQLQTADQKLQNRQRMFNFKNPFYSEWGMKYGPHALTAAIPLLAIFHASNLTGSCSALSLQCAQVFFQQSFYFPLVLAAGMTYLSCQAAAQAKPLLKDVSSLREKVQVCETFHQKTKQGLNEQKQNAEKDHKLGIQALRTAKDEQESLTKKQNLINGEMSAIRTSIIGDVYNRCIKQLEDVFNQLETHPQDMFARKIGSSAMQNVIDLIITSFSDSKRLVLGGNNPALPIED